MSSRYCLLAVYVLLGMIGIVSCSGNQSGTTSSASSNAKAIGPEMAAEQIRVWLTNRPCRYDLFFDMFYFTADWQRDRIAVTRTIQEGIAELDAACLERFGKPYATQVTGPWPTEVMQLVQQSDSEAQIHCSEGTFSPKTIYLIRSDDKWLVDAERTLANEGSTMPEELRRSLLAEAQRIKLQYSALAQRVRNNEVTWEQAIQQ